MVAMKGSISDQERIQAASALGILGADRLEAVRLHPFQGARERWVYLAKKTRGDAGRSIRVAQGSRQNGPSVARPRRGRRH